ncbi:nuclear transport factor 2 family protein [Pacificoceanicola onchidii]|uniref:nuclear transport factor 2 family protein n=1 Tax=Pacificoceanicola onchidii TaxID=2562685 RepID=UPI0010A5DB15|nr:nuclear transport factor 2 family protein [Pacificoceanicola onchidii]
MDVRDFLKRYEAALASQDWAQVSPLIHGSARVVFSDGSVHEGLGAIERAYQRNFAAIKSERFVMDNIHWVFETADHAVYMFDFHWSGVIQGREASGSGRGVTALVRENDIWLLKAEQLGPA